MFTKSKDVEHLLNKILNILYTNCVKFNIKGMLISLLELETFYWYNI